MKLFLDCHFLSDRSPREDFTYRDFELGAFPIRADIADDRMLRSVMAYPQSRFDRVKRSIFEKTNKVGYISEKGFYYAPVSPATISKSNYASGFWQSEKYFKAFENNIRRDLSVVSPLLGDAGKYTGSINDSESVSIHVRRGDYVNNSFHPLCTIDYYVKATEVITQNVENPVFFIFSDDPDWVTDNLPLKWPYQIVKGNTGVTDLYLMSRCKHNIIANSSFSWWGAWLNDNGGKVVVAPQKWFGDPQINTDDLIPEGWIKL